MVTYKEYEENNLSLNEQASCVFKSRKILFVCDRYLMMKGIHKERRSLLYEFSVTTEVVSFQVEYDYLWKHCLLVVPAGESLQTTPPPNY